MEFLTFITVCKSFQPITFWLHFLQFLLTLKSNSDERAQKTKKTYKKIGLRIPFCIHFRLKFVKKKGRNHTYIF
jgi:hypothetical protein